MPLLEGVDWQGSIFTAGGWAPGRGGDFAVVEPATQRIVGRIRLDEWTD